MGYRFLFFVKLTSACLAVGVSGRVLLFVVS